MRLAMIRICLGLALLAGAGHILPAVAQPADGRAGAVAATAVAQARLLAGNDPATVYDGVHPDLRNILPRRAFVAWVNQQPYAQPVADPVITGLTFGDWTWPATGISYPETVLVTFRLATVIDSVQMEVSTSWRFAFDGNQWRWLPDLTAADIPALPAAIVDFPGGYTTPFRQSSYIAIDRFWQGEMYAANRPYLPPEIVPVTSDNVDTGCGTVQQVRRLAVFYCVYDATIYFAPAFRDEVIDETGPYGWTAVIAHEWGHHIQALIGIDAGGAGNAVDLELQADCLAALVAQDSLARGEIGDAEVANATAVFRLAGDVPGTTAGDPAAHGTSAERMEWFQAGFDRGFTGCHLNVRTA